MALNKNNLVRAELIKLRDNISGDYIKKLQEERKLSGNMKDLVDATLTAIIKQEDVSEDSIEAFNILLSLSYLEGYSSGSKSEVKQISVTEHSSESKPIIKRIRRKKD